ncbi:hypothetical protein T05_15758 [Trichinella murrelli]|uniref:Uncharacterized protein n=1 Tax=Trichinella murrelli TaxID=144512 RepID=A0A0V0T9R9_9BILA|nr:hypothetical protein T05_15758 [Trichinella murrelli]
MSDICSKSRCNLTAIFSTIVNELLMVVLTLSELKGTWCWSKMVECQHLKILSFTAQMRQRAQGFLQSFHQKNFDVFYPSLPISTHPWSSFCNELPLDSLGGKFFFCLIDRFSVKRLSYFLIQLLIAVVLNQGNGGMLKFCQLFFLVILVRILVPLASTYLSETGFSALMALYTHTQHHSRQIAKRVKYLRRCAYQLARDISRLQVRFGGIG